MRHLRDLQWLIAVFLLWVFMFFLYAQKAEARFKSSIVKTAKHGYRVAISALQGSSIPSFELTETGDILLSSYGQSLSVGTNGAPAQSTTGDGSSLRQSSLAALVEATVETHVTASTHALRNADDGTRVYISDTSGVSGKDCALLSKGSAEPTNYTNLTGKVTSVESSRPGTVVAALNFIHGESDAADDCNAAGCGSGVYSGCIADILDDFDADVKVINSQTRDVAMFLCQLSSFTQPETSDTDPFSWVPVEQKSLADSRSDVFLVTPKYHLGLGTNSIYSSDGVHLGDNRVSGARGYKVLGDYYGRAMDETFLNNRPWTPLQPSSAAASGSTIVVTYDVPCTRMGTCGVNPLALDTTAVEQAIHSGTPTYGFRINDPNPVPRYITNVSVSGNEVTLTANAAISSGTSVDYALHGYAASHGGNGFDSTNFGSARGNLRDTDTTTGHKSSETLVNWAVHSRTSVTGGATPPSSIATVIDDVTWTWAYVVDSAWPGVSCTSETDWTPLAGGHTMPWGGGTYACDGSTSGADTAAIGTARDDEALVNTNGYWLSTGNPSVFESTADEDIWIRFVGETQRPGANEYLLWYGVVDANNRYYIQFQSNGNIAVVFGSDDGNLTAIGAAMLPASSTYGIVDVFIDKEDRNRRLRIQIAVNGTFYAASHSSADGGANSGVNMALLSAFNGSGALSQNVTFIGAAIGQAASKWSREKHTADYNSL